MTHVLLIRHRQNVPNVLSGVVEMGRISPERALLTVNQRNCGESAGKPRKEGERQEPMSFNPQTTQPPPLDGGPTRTRALIEPFHAVCDPDCIGPPMIHARLGRWHSLQPWIDMRIRQAPWLGNAHRSTFLTWGNSSSASPIVSLLLVASRGLASSRTRLELT